MLYYTAPSADVPAATIHRAQAKPTTSLDIALGRMGEGVVFNRFGAVVAFHESQAVAITRAGTARMTHWDEVV